MRRKNFIMLFTFFIAIFGALLVTMINKEFDKSLFYRTALILYFLLYTYLKKLTGFHIS